MILLKKKKEYEHVFSRHYRKCSGKTEGKLVGETFGEDFRELVEKMPFDPCPYIDDIQDWHLQGGNLDVITVFNKQMLASSSKVPDDDTSVRLIKTNSEFQHMEFDQTQELKLNNFAYEIMQSNMLFGVRRKKTVDIFWRYLIIKNENATIQPNSVYKWSQEIAASALQEDKLLLLDVKKFITRCSTEPKRAESIVKINEDETFPFTICAHDENIATFTARKSLNQVDFREGKIRKLFDDEEMFLTCETLTCQKKSTMHPNTLYVGSTHFLYGLDLRSTNQLQLHWTHQLMLAPTIIKTAQYEDNEVICLASNEPDDLKIFNSSRGRKSGAWQMNWLNVKPIHQKSSYDKLRSRGLLLTHNEMKHRLSLSTTGVAMLPDFKRARISLFTQNSLGDVFKSYLNCRKEAQDDESRIKGNFMEWGKSLEQQTAEHRHLHVTNIANLKGLSKVLTGEKTIQHEPVEEPLTRNTPRWECNIEEATEYQDALAHLLLEAWDLEIEDTQPKAFAEALTNEAETTMQSVNKVSNWLQTAEEEIPDDDVHFLTCSFAQDDTMVTSTQNPGPSGTAKKAKRVSRVKGF